MNGERSLLLETILTTVVAVLAFVTVWSMLSEDISMLLPALAVSGLTIVGFSVLRMSVNPDHLRARQSDRTLRIANETLSFLRDGLSRESAQAVCRIILPATQAVAIAITDTRNILGFAGEGEDHHSVGGPIITRGTMATLDDHQPRILNSRTEIGCPEPGCALRAAIVVPLEVRGHVVGTLKFYYRSPKRINETQMAMAEGLAQLLSTQLGLAELDRQADLAMRSELKALQAQINPHFLFNTINTIAALIRTDPAQARILLREFAVFYRRTLENSEDLIPLGKEIEQTLRYIGFEIARFGDRIEIHTDIQSGLDTLHVPAFVIQPLVENAVNHAMRDEGALRIEMRVYCLKGDLIIEVADDGVGIKEAELPKVMDPGYGKGLGIALKNVEDRIKGYFGPGSHLRIESTYGAGTVVTLVLKDANKDGLEIAC